MLLRRRWRWTLRCVSPTRRKSSPRILRVLDVVGAIAETIPASVATATVVERRLMTWFKAALGPNDPTLRDRLRSLAELPDPGSDARAGARRRAVGNGGHPGASTPTSAGLVLR